MNIFLIISEFISSYFLVFIMQRLNKVVLSTHSIHFDLFLTHSKQVKNLRN